MQTVTLSGLHCEACVKLLSKRLSKLPHVTSVDGNPDGVFEIIATTPLTSSQISEAVSGTEYKLESVR